MTKYFVLTVGLVSGIALGAGTVIAQDAAVQADVNADATVSANDDTLKIGTGMDVDTAANTAVDSKPVATTGDKMTAGADIMLTGNINVTSDALLGASVYDSNEQLIGEVAQVVTDLGSGESQVVVDVGGFLGLGEHPVLLTMGELDIETSTDGDIETVTVLRTKAELEAMPAYEG